MTKRLFILLTIFCLLFFSSLSDCCAGHKIRVGIYNFNPLVFTDDSGKASGLFTDFLNYIAEKENWDITYIPGSWGDSLARVENGEIDLLVCIAHTKEREAKLDFTNDYLILDWASVFKQKGSHIETIFDLQDKTVSVVKSGVTTDAFKRVLTQFGIICNIIEKNENIENLKAVHNKEAEAGVCPNIYGTMVEDNYNIERTSIVFAPIRLGFASQKGSSKEILSALNSHIAELKQDKSSIYYDLRSKWIGVYGKDKILLAKWAGVLLTIFIALFLIVTLFNITLKEKVKEKTAELLEINNELMLSEERYRTLFEKALRDIAEREFAEKENQRLQQQLVQAQKMESIGRLAGGVAHDFNNMLGVIIGHVEILLHNFKNTTDEMYIGLSSINKAAKRSADLTKQLLAFARKQTVNPKLIDLNKAVEGMLSMVERLIGENIDLVWIGSENLGSVKIDPVQIDQIMVNLCINAKDAILEKEDNRSIDKDSQLFKGDYQNDDNLKNIGKITIETKNIIFNDKYCDEHVYVIPGSYVMLAISDNGCGMDKETISKIFDPFFTTKDMDRGTGLGLASVYGIVKQNNGFINVYSELNQGTTFKIYLPKDEENIITSETSPSFKQSAKTEKKIEFLSDEIDKREITSIDENEITSTDENEITPIDESKMVYGSGTILLVEDEEWLLELGEIMIQKLGYSVLTASTPKEAVDFVLNYPQNIDLVITDVIMPEMNGQELSKKLLQVRPNIKTLFMSGYTANVIAQHGVLEQGINFIQKPFSIQELSEKIGRILKE